MAHRRLLFGFGFALAACAPAVAPPPALPKAAPAALNGASGEVGVAAPATTPEPARGKPLLFVRAGRLFDATSDAYKTDVVIAVAGDRIDRVVPAAEANIPPGAHVVDLSKKTVLPGLIDAHTHLAARADQYEEILTFKTTAFDAAIAAVVNAKKTLDAGFTTVRDLNSPPFLAVDVKRNIEEGFIPGPRMVASGPAISITGGHTDMNGWAPWVRGQFLYPEERDWQVVDGVDQMRHAVRGQIKYGVDVIKVCASGGVFSRGDKPGSPQFTVEELRAAVEEAHATGRKVAAHAHGAQGIKNAVIAGVDSIEHGSFLDDQGIELMKEHGTFLVADIYNDDYILGHAEDLHMPAEFVEKERSLGKTQRESFARAVKARVKIAFGTDAGVYPHGDNAKQFAKMVQYGMTPAGAIRAATSSNAELLGRPDVGMVVSGRYADLIAVDGDPLKDVTVLEHVDVVIKGGAIVKGAE